MNNRGGIVAFFLFLFLILAVVLQVYSMIQSDRFYRKLNLLEDKFQSGTIEITSDVSSETTTQDYQGDEGDWLVWAFRVEPKTLNQFNVDNDIYSKWITVPYIFEPLLFYNFDTLEFEPWLAESYKISDDKLEYTFRLREDVYFSDGVPVTPDDVIFTYETAVDPNIDAATVANLFVDVEKVIRLDERTVKFIMKRPYFKAIENLCFWDFGILPKHIYEYKNAREFNTRVSDPIGSGPFVFERWVTGREIVLRRNENYWGKKPKLKKIVFKFVNNPVAAVQALRAHKVDMIIPEPEQFADLVNDEDFNKDFRCLSYWNPGAPFYYIGWNQDTVFFKDKRVRLAMTHIVDRKQIVSKLLKKQGEEISGPFFIKGPYGDPNIESWPYDIEKAKKLLDEAGWVDTDGDGIREKDGVPFRFRFMYSADKALYKRLVKLLKDEAEKVGIEVIPEPYEWSVMLPKLSDRQYEAMVMGWGGDVMEDFYQIFHSSQIGNRGANYVSFANERADELLEKIRVSFDKGERIKLCRQFHRILHEEQPYTFLFARPTFRPVDRRFKNVTIYHLGPKYWEWYVPKELQRYK